MYTCDACPKCAFSLTCACHITMPGMDVRHMHVSMHVPLNAGVFALSSHARMRLPCTQDVCPHEKTFHNLLCHYQLEVKKVQVLFMRLNESIKRSSLRCSSFTSRACQISLPAASPVKTCLRRLCGVVVCLHNV